MVLGDFIWPNVKKTHILVLFTCKCIRRIGTLKNAIENNVFPQRQPLYQDFSFNIDPNGHKNDGGITGLLG